METKRLSDEVLSRLSELDKSELKGNLQVVMNDFVNKVFEDLLDAGYDVIVSKTDMTMLYSLDLAKYMDVINDQVFKSAKLSTPAT
jgi:hypothetical protein